MDTSTLEAVIRTHGRGRPDATLGIFDGRPVTYGAMHERSSRVGNGLRAEGLKPDSRVAILSKNEAAVFEVLFGARKTGAVQVAVNWRLSADEMQYIVADSGAETLFVGDGFLEQAKSIAEKLPSLRKVIALGEDPGPFEGYEAWLAKQSPEDPGFSSQPDDVALQLYTSGTTGRPKGAMLMNRNIFAFISAAHRALGSDPDGVYLNCLPLFHVGGVNWALQAFALGAHVIIFRDFDADALVAAIEKRRVTHMITVPAVIQALLARPLARSTDFSSLRVAGYGGSSISETLLRDAIATFGNCLHGMYGSTELSFAVTLLSPAEHVTAEHPEWLRSCGRTLPGSEIRVLDPVTLTDVAEGVTGEIWVQSPQRGLGYWKQAEATGHTFRSDGWFRTGDLGHVVDGYLYLSDRLNDMIISGGENVYPAEIERVLGEHPDVAQVVAFGVPDVKWGEAAHAVVVRAPNATPDPEALLEYVRERLAHYKCPRAITFAEALPMTASGKVQRAQLRAPFWEGHTRRIA